MTVVNLVDAHHTATTTTTVATTTTTTPRSLNTKQRSIRSNRTIIVIIWMIFIMALYPAIGTVQFSRIQKQLLQPIQDQPLISFINNNEYYNKVDDDKEANEKEIEREADSTKQKQKRLPSKFVRAKKVSMDESNTTSTVAMMKRSNNNNNNDKLITAFDDHGVNKQQHGFIVIKGDDDSSSAMTTTKLRNDLEMCFSPLINNNAVTIKKWLKGRSHQHFICHLDGIGSFQIIECRRHDIYFVESRDEEDYGTPYFMKLGPTPKVLRDEMEIIYYLSSINKGSVNNLTAKPHPRYPYIEWKRTIPTTTNTTHDKKNQNKNNAKFNKVAVIFEERLNFTSLGNFQKNKLSTIDQVMSSSNQKQVVQCWQDVVTVTEALWDYQGGHTIHNDIHNGQILMVPITKEGDNSNNDTNNDTDGIQYRCHVIDFGMVRSLDQVTKSNRNLRHSNKNPFWYTQLSNKYKIADYIREYGIEEYYKRGQEFSASQWGQTLFLKQLLKIMFGDNLYLGFNNHQILTINTNNSNKYDQYGPTVAGWCQASKMIKKLVQKLEQYQKQRPDIDDALFRLVLEQSTIIDSGVSILNCTNYKAVLT